MVQPDYSFLEDAPLEFEYAMVYPVIDTITEQKVDEDGERYKKTKQRRRCTTLLFSMHEQYVHPETGSIIMRERAFNLRLPFLTYRNDAYHAGFSSAQIIRALNALPGCQHGKKPSGTDMFYFVPITKEEIAERTRIAADPELSDKFRKLQEEARKPIPDVGSLMAELGEDEKEELAIA